MRILLFGATGGTGRQLIEQGLASGHQITAFARNSAALAITHKNFSVRQGNILDEKNISDAMQKQEIVISVLGNRSLNIFQEPNHIISHGMRNIISGMKKGNVKRLLFTASFAVNEDIFLPQKFLMKRVLKNLFADIPLQERLIKESNLDWTIVHPARLTNGEKTGKYKSSEHLPIGISSHISRADVADFLLKNVQNKELVKKTITISY